MALSKININWVEGLISALAGKAPSTHNHVVADITDYVASQSGMIIQNVRAETAAMSTTAVLIPNDDTIPQITEGAEFLTLAFTPKRADSTLEIYVEMSISPSVVGTPTVAVFVNTTASAIAAQNYSMTNAYAGKVGLTFRVPAGSTTARTYRVRAGLNVAGTLTVNGIGGARFLGGVMTSSITVREIAA